MRRASFVMAVVLCSSSSFGAPPKKEKPVMNFPRVDLYVQKDKVVKRCAADQLEAGIAPKRVEEISEQVAVIWRDETSWSVSTAKAIASGDCVEVFTGSLREFATYSPLINVGFEERAPLAGSGIALSLSAGMPNTVTYSLTVEPSGRFALSYGGHLPPAGSNGFDPDTLAALLAKAARLGKQAGASIPRRPAHDAQQTTLRLLVNGRVTTIDDGAFIEEVKNAYGINPYPAHRGLGR